MRRLLVPVVLGAAVVLVLGSFSAGGAAAQEPTPTPPPPTWTPGPAPAKTPVPTPTPRHPGGAWIRLRVRGGDGSGNWWTEVQWQDEEGKWHPVEGWQGPLERLDGEWGRVWWVSQSQFGTGPFRWVIYRRQGGEPVALSDPFTLPETEGATRWVEVSLEAIPTPTLIPFLPISGENGAWAPHLLLLAGGGAIALGIGWTLIGQRKRSGLQDTAGSRRRHP